MTSDAHVWMAVGYRDRLWQLGCSGKINMNKLVIQVGTHMAGTSRV